MTTSAQDIHQLQARRVGELNHEIALARGAILDHLRARDGSEVPGLTISQAVHRINVWEERHHQMEIAMEELVRRRDAILAAREG